MSEDPSRSLDVLGIKPVANAIEHASKATIDGASSFLSKVCMPAAEEFGLLLQDKIRGYRARNTAAILLEAEARVEKFRPGLKVAIHPRLLAATLNGGGWTDDDSIQKMWAGLLASACTEDGDDDGNLIFIDLLGRLTSAQVRILNYACEATPKRADANGLINYRSPLESSAAQLLEISKLPDIHRLDMELAHLKEIGLIMAGFDSGMTQIDAVATTASPLALNLYVRCQGFVGPAPEYFGLVPTSH